MERYNIRTHCSQFLPEKDDPHRVHLTVGGNRINFPGDCGTPTADMITVKILLNSVISTTNAKFMTIDIKDFYLNTPMERPEFMRLKLADLPDNIIKLYKLHDLCTTVMRLYVSRMVCMDSCKQEKLHKNFWKNASKVTGTTRAKSILVSGRTAGAPYVLH